MGIEHILKLVLFQRNRLGVRNEAFNVFLFTLYIILQKRTSGDYKILVLVFSSVTFSSSFEHALLYSSAVPPGWEPPTTYLRNLPDHVRYPCRTISVKPTYQGKPSGPFQVNLLYHVR